METWFELNMHGISLLLILFLHLILHLHFVLFLQKQVTSKDKRKEKKKKKQKKSSTIHKIRPRPNVVKSYPFMDGTGSVERILQEEDETAREDQIHEDDDFDSTDWYSRLLGKSVTSLTGQEVEIADAVAHALQLRSQLQPQFRSNRPAIVHSGHNYAGYYVQPYPLYYNPNFAPEHFEHSPHSANYIVNPSCKPQNHYLDCSIQHCMPFWFCTEINSLNLTSIGPQDKLSPDFDTDIHERRFSSKPKRHRQTRPTQYGLTNLQLNSVRSFCGKSLNAQKIDSLFSIFREYGDDDRSKRLSMAQLVKASTNYIGEQVVSAVTYSPLACLPLNLFWCQIINVGYKSNNQRDYW